MHEIDKILTAARDLLAANQRGVLVTVVRTAGSTYRRAGARALIAEDGRAFGAISGGCLERDLAARIKPWLDDPRPRIVTYDSTRADDVVFGLGLGCRGILDLLVEPVDAAQLPPLVKDFRWNGREPVAWTTTLPDGECLEETIQPERAVLVFGNGGDVEPVVRIGETIGWDVRNIRGRRDWPPLHEFDAAVIMTHNFMLDVDILRALVPAPVPYIGLLGPKRRGEELLAELGGDTTELRPRIHSPIGLDIGGETPEEIALSIVAEVQAVLNRRSAKLLRELRGPIHEEVLTVTCES
ncbi:MAG TPA: XdhC family protein [Thermoanaerobaculia bacterium]|jgi:xanthine/CO dehydrogenase XdhC/CoxF family maturation factor